MLECEICSVLRSHTQVEKSPTSSNEITSPKSLARKQQPSLAKQNTHLYFFFTRPGNLHYKWVKRRRWHRALGMPCGIATKCTQQKCRASISRNDGRRDAHPHSPTPTSLQLIAVSVEWNGRDICQGHLTLSNVVRIEPKF